MTDKPVPPLNLIERMAQRLEKEAANQPSANVIGRAMERDTLDGGPVLKNGGAAPSVTMREPAPAPQPVQPQIPSMPRGVSAIGPAAGAHVPPPRMPEQPHTVAPPPGKTVRLDFRALDRKS